MVFECLEGSKPIPNLVECSEGSSSTNLGETIPVPAQAKMRDERETTYFELAIMTSAKKKIKNGSFSVK